MSCTLRAHGESFQVREFLESSSIAPDAVFENNDSTTSGKTNGSHTQVPGFMVTISTAELTDLEGQIREAILFLDEYEDELRRLASFSGVDGLSLDFAIQWRGVSVQTDLFPADLLWRAGALDIWLAVSHHLSANKTRDDTGEQKN